MSSETNQRPRLDQPIVAPACTMGPEWGSDVVAEMLRKLGLEYAALNPGSSYRGLHDSMVNYNGNSGPGIILCNHEEIAVAVAHGYAKATGRPMAAIVHANVGLMHASMGIFDAWVDRVPVMVLGGTGPMDPTLRRPWTDWVHTSDGQGQIVRDVTKWEHQPASVAAIPETMVRAWKVMMTEPRGPVYVCFDAGLQEQRLDPSSPVELLDPARYPVAGAPAPDYGALREAARLLVGADYPVILAGRCGQTEQGWKDLVELAEALGAATLTDMKNRASFPTDHILHPALPTYKGDVSFHETLHRADVVMALEWIDPAGSLLGLAWPVHDRGDAPTSTKKHRLINVSLEDYAVTSWVEDCHILLAAEVPILSTPERTVGPLLQEVRRLLAEDPAARGRVEQRMRAHRQRRAELELRWTTDREAAWKARPIRPVRAIGELAAALGDRREDAVVARSAWGVGWPADLWSFRRPGAFLGCDGGGGLGSGPGMAVGAALGLKGTGRLPVAILGDGDFLMASTALWTAAHHRLPLLMVVLNNRSYANDEKHQARVARTRGRPEENKWIGLWIDDPAINLAGLARQMGAEGIGPVQDPAELRDTYKRALHAVDEGRPVLVEVLTGR